MGEPVKNCLIADDHALMREALRGTVALLWPDARSDVVADYPAVIAAAEQRSYDLILCDLAMPGANPLEGVGDLLALASCPVMIITGSEDDTLLLALLGMGVAGFLGKSASGAVVEAAIALVAAGGIYLPPRLIALSMPGNAGKSSAESAPITPRQLDVLTLLTSGASNKEIARQLNLSPATIKVHVAALLSTLGVRNRAEATKLAISRGWAVPSA